MKIKKKVCALIFKRRNYNKYAKPPLIDVIIYLTM